MSSTAETLNLRRPLEDSPMRRGQVIAILLALSIAILDGFDVSSMSFVAPVIARAWAVDKAALGLLLATGLVGMAAGSLALSPFADKFGRKPLVLTALGLVTLGTFACGMSSTLPQLVASRALTGLGMGSLVSLLATMAAEFSNARSRSMAVATITIGLPLGGAVGGAVSAAVLRGGHDWHGIFFIGAIAGAVMSLVAVLTLPESPAFLIDRRPADALARLNKVLRRLGHDGVDDLPPVASTRTVSYRALFSRGTASDTVRLIAVNVLMIIAGYYIINWLPQIIAGLGFTPATASLVASMSGVLGIASPLICGALAMRLGTARVATVVMICFGLSLVVIGFVPPVLAMVVLAACSAAFFLSGSAAVFQARVIETFSPPMRATALGFILGVGRVGSGLGPYLAGLMFGAGMTRGTVSICFAVLTVIAGLLVGVTRPKPVLAMS